MYRKRGKFLVPLFSLHIFGMQLVFVFAQPAKVDNEQVLKCDRV